MPAHHAEPVHVWKVPLAQPPAVVEACRRLLCPEELQRADAFHFERDRGRWAVARGALRLILARELGGKARPAALAFAQGPHGKPGLASAGQGTGVSAPQFNLSHCEDLALVAVAGRRAVGVDVERIRPLSDLRTIQERYFSAEEREFLAAAARAPGGSGAGAPRDPCAFFTLWTRREAAAKALGLDLQAALTRIRLPLYPAGGSAALAELLDSGGPWWLADLALGAEHAGAVCVQGEPPGATAPALVLHDFLPADFSQLR